MTEAEEIAILKDQIEVLTEQIEKMKCCWNCANYSFYIPEADRFIKGKDDTKCYKCKKSLHKGKEDKWELSD